MKKQLLALAIAACTTFAGMAEKVAFVADGANYTGDGNQSAITNAEGATNLFSSSPSAGATASFTNGDITITFTKKNTSHSQVNGSLVRWYQYDELTVTPLNGATITAVSLVGVGSSYTGNTVNLKYGTETGTLATGATRTWTGSTTDDFIMTAGKQVRFATVEVTYTPGQAPAVATPVITAEEGAGEEGGTLVTITCETEGATIHYTEDGSDPTAASSAYTASFTAFFSETIKAIAVKDNETSAVATKAIEVPMALPDLSALASIDEATLTDGFGGAVKVSVTCPLRYVYQSGAYLYLTDGSYNVLCYGTAETYKPGDAFTNVKGTFCFHYGTPELKDYTLSEATASENIEQPLEAEEIAWNIYSGNVNKWITISGVSISEVNGKDAVMTDASGATVALRNTFGTEGFADGSNYTISGIVGLYKAANATEATVQFQPTSIEAYVDPGKVATPEFSLEAGAYPAETEFTISCPTEGATIVYTINDGNTVEAPAPVVLKLTEDMTIAAYGMKEGMTDSDMAEVAYTVEAEQAGGTATFDFANAETFANITCAPAVTYPGSGQNVDVDGVKMTADKVTLTTTKGSNPSKIYQNGGNLRFYANGTLNFNIPSEYTITKITFTATDFYVSTTTGTLEAKVWTAPATAVNSLSFSASKTNKINKIEVEYAKVETGIEAVEVEEGAEAIYYNLQGVRVENPANGLYIRVAGKTASKVYIR